ncbi:hypothetical protein FJZ26_02755 [Candidatus Parvarchaeota archaeon]|nr:hypothetical protein [Candidatus Parvarchaeota archaeon]
MSPVYADPTANKSWYEKAGEFVPVAGTIITGKDAYLQFKDGNIGRGAVMSIITIASAATDVLMASGIFAGAGAMGKMGIKAATRELFGLTAKQVGTKITKTTLKSATARELNATARTAMNETKFASRELNRLNQLNRPQMATLQSADPALRKLGTKVSGLVTLSATQSAVALKTAGGARQVTLKKDAVLELVKTSRQAQSAVTDATMALVKGTAWPIGVGLVGGVGFRQTPAIGDWAEPHLYSATEWLESKFKPSQQTSGKLQGLNPVGPSGQVKSFKTWKSD